MSATAAAPPNFANIKWHTGKKLDQQLELPLSVTWSEAPLRPTLIRLAQQQQVAIFLDRRIDPGIAISLSQKDVTLEQLLWKLASQLNLGVCRLDDFFYVGPTKTTEQLPYCWKALGEQARKLKPHSPVAWDVRHDFQIPPISNPADVLAKLAAKNRFGIVGPSLPHDCWPRVDLPDLSLDQQVAVLCVGFGEWFEISRQGDQIRIIPFPEIDSATRRFGPIDRTSLSINGLRQAFPDCVIDSEGGSFTATGSPADLAAIEKEWIESRNTKQNPATGEKRFTLATRASRGQILATIAQQTGNRLKFDPAIQNLLEEQIELKVKEIDLDELIKETLTGTGAGYRIVGGELQVFIEP